MSEDSLTAGSIDSSGTRSVDSPGEGSVDLSGLGSVGPPGPGSVDSPGPGSVDSPGAGSTASRPPIRARDLIVALIVLVAWIAPITEGALRGFPGEHWPRRWRDLCAVSCLFKQRPERFTYYTLQVRREGVRGWEAVDEPRFFPMEPFGHRSRFDRFMDRWGAESLGSRAELAEWLAARDRQLAPDEPPIAAVRFVAAVREIRADDPPRGHWQKPATAPGSRVRIDSTHVIGEAPKPTRARSRAADPGDSLLEGS